MQNLTKKYCFIYPYKLPLNSVLRRIYIKNEVSDYSEPIQVFDNGRYNLSIKIDQDKKLDEFIYRFDCEESIDKYGKDKFKEEALDGIIKSLECLQFAFIGLQSQTRERLSDSRKESHPLIGVLDYKTGETKTILEFEASYNIRADITISFHSMHTSLEEICRTLKYPKKEQLTRFLSIDKLSLDPVLHLTTLYCLYEYIAEGGKNENFTSLFGINIFGKSTKKHKGKPISKEIDGRSVKTEQGGESYLPTTFLDKFKRTRDFVSHGFVSNQTTLNILKQFLKSSSNEEEVNRLSFDRYDESHINLVSDVIGEAQNIIQKYLREDLKNHKSS
jgi:hypothetical protein